MSDSPGALLAALLVGSAVKYGAGVWLRWRDTRSFKLVGRVAALYVFPIKSFRGIAVEKGELTRLGLKNAGVTDRYKHVLVNYQYIHSHSMIYLRYWYIVYIL
jgi:hypothetical protein